MSNTASDPQIKFINSPDLRREVVLMSGVRPTFALHRDAAGVSRRARATGPSCGPVSSTRVDPRVWSVAMDLCGGDPLRLEIVSPTEVVVHNRPPIRPRRST